MDEMKACLLRSNKFVGEMEKLNLTDKRVDIYNELIWIGNTIQYTVLKNANRIYMTIMLIDRKSQLVVKYILNNLMRYIR